MRNIKIEQGLDKDEHWPSLSIVSVAGDPESAKITESMSQQEAEAVIQSWHRIAILQVQPVIDVYFGFYINGLAQFLNVPIEMQAGKFGVHVGPENTDFFVFAKDMTSQPTLRLVEVTDINNLAYRDLPLY